MENYQVAVYLAYTTPRAHALIDHRLYLPASWTDDEVRLRGAGVPENVEFATKPELTRQMIHAALEHVPQAWVTGDEVYGRNPGLRTYLEEQRVGYVMEMAATDRMATPRGPLAVKELAVLVPEQAWQKRSAGAGTKGERFYDWALIDDHADAAGVLQVRHRPLLRIPDRVRPRVRGALGDVTTLVMAEGASRVRGKHPRHRRRKAHVIWRRLGTHAVFDPGPP